jgi:hypothetical protein
MEVNDKSNPALRSPRSRRHAVLDCHGALDGCHCADEFREDAVALRTDDAIPARDRAIAHGVTVAFWIGSLLPLAFRCREKKAERLCPS